MSYAQYPPALGISSQAQGGIWVERYSGTIHDPCYGSGGLVWTLGSERNRFSLGQVSSDSLKRPQGKRRQKNHVAHRDEG